MLGSAALLDASGAPTGQQRRRIALLALVAASGELGVSRDRLMARLNPESPSDSARHALHQLLYYLRQQAGEDLFVGSDPLRLNPAVVSCDLADFEQALARGADAMAVALYRGPFLDGFHLGDSPEFEEWSAGERARLAASHADALFRLAREADAREDVNQAIEWWRRLVTIDPLDGRATLGLLRALAFGGDSPGAVRQARTHRVLVEAELGRAPDPEIDAFVATLSVEARQASHQESLRPTATVPGRAKGPGLGRFWSLLGVGVAAVLIIAGWRWQAGRAEAGRSIARLAVLPLVNGSSDPAVAAVADALTQELISSLTSTGFRVLGYYPVSKYLGTRLPLEAIGRELNVDAVATWTVLRQEGRWRVSLEVARAPSGEGLWSSTRYVVDSLQLPDVAEGAARELASRFAAEPAGRKRQLSLRTSQGSSEAKLAYLLGMDGLWRGSRGVEFSRRQFERALAADSNFAPSYAGLGYLLSWSIDYGHLPLHDACRRAKPVIDQALLLDADLPLAHLARARVLQDCDWNWKEADAEYRRAIVLEPSAMTYHHYGWFLEWYLGRAREGVAMQDTALALEPGSPLEYLAMAWRLRGAGELDRAEEAASTGLALAPDGLDGHWVLAEVYLQQGDYAAAEREALTLRATEGTAAPNWSMLGEIYGHTGREPEARAYLRQLGREEPMTGAARVAIARTRMALGERDAALTGLEQAVTDGIFIMPHQPYWNPIRAEPRFQALVRRMGL
jgi:serine/threonine-protein kinase